MCIYIYIAGEKKDIATIIKKKKRNRKQERATYGIKWTD
jgi:hypothetical protein